MKDAHEVGGVLWRHHFHMAKEFHAVQHDMHTVTMQRKPRCTCDKQLGLRLLSSPLFLKPEQLNPTVTRDLKKTRVETCPFRNWLGKYFCFL